MRKHLILLCFFFFLTSAAVATEEVHYTGTTLSDPTRLDGGLAPVIGVHNIQTLRASRCDTSQVTQGWTYNHQPMLAYHNGRFWMHYLANPVGEHIPPGATFMQSSADGYHWTTPVTLFPVYPLPEAVLSRRQKIYNPDGTLHKVSDTVQYKNMFPRETLTAVMHQRVGWYVSSPATGSKLLAIGHYGICLHPKDDPNDGHGIGRVVREVKADGSLGPIYFLYYNHGWKASNTRYPHYSQAPHALRKAIDEILRSPLYWMQFVEECDRNDPRLPLKKNYKAFNYYTLPDGKTLVALWKHALTSTSHDGGRTWDTLVHRAPGFVNSNAKIWGQRLTDGMYATVYNPSEFRWPLALSLSADGLEYTTLHCVHGDITPMRYGGNYKSNGPQYVRGILPGNGLPPDSDLWVSYSVNKEDIWVAHLPVPIRTVATSHATAQEIAEAKTLADLREWNLYSPRLAPVSLAAGRSAASSAAHWQTGNVLVLADGDPFDYARADRLFPATRHLVASVCLTPQQDSHGELQVEVSDSHGHPCTHVCFQPDGSVQIKTGARHTTLLKHYTPFTPYTLRLEVDLDSRMLTASLSSPSAATVSKRAILYAPLHDVGRLTFRTGARRTDLTPDTPPDRAAYDDLTAADSICPTATWTLAAVTTAEADTEERLTSVVDHDTLSYPCVTPALLRFAQFLPYINDFNAHDKDTLPSLISNDEAATWLQHEIPLFECPDKQMETLFYYRYWALRKHIVLTERGYAQTEFRVARSYADRYNLIACAISHHLMEARWLHNPAYALGEAYTWLRLHDGQPLEKLHAFSPLLPFALYETSKVLGSPRYMLALHDDLVREMQWWDDTHLWGNVAAQAAVGRREPADARPFAPADSLYWQSDVSDGMEESISGGRYSTNKGYLHQHRRPSINSYMYGNYSALAEAYRSTEYDAEAARYAARATALQRLVTQRLWSDSLQFFTARDKYDSLTLVRELVGYLPWYTSLPQDDSARFAPVWRQLALPEGFLAPYGMYTAERRHPLFRTHWKGRPTCEWDGAVWPFATSQTLTALAHVMQRYPLTAAALPEGLFFDHLRRYTQSMYLHGEPYVGEYLDGDTGAWLWGDAERSRHYNHSTYNDLIITGLVGLCPSLSEAGITLRPLLPAGTWDYFCLDGVRYHDHTLTILWDATGLRYGQGQGFTLLVDGRRAGHRTTLGPLSVSL